MRRTASSRSTSATACSAQPPLAGIRSIAAAASASAPVSITFSASGAQNGLWSEASLRRLPLVLGHPADPEDQRFDAIGVGPAVLAEILATHYAGHLHHPVFAEAGAKAAHHGFGKLGIVEGGRRVGIGHGHHRQLILRNTRRNRLAPRDPGNPVEQQLARLVSVAAHGQLQLRLVGNDVVLGPGAEAAHGDHTRLQRRQLATDQRLQLHHDRTRQHDRVLGRLRIGTVSADALHRDVHTVDIGQRIARRIADRPGGELRGIVESDCVVGLGEAGEQPVFQHRQRALAHLFSGLQDHHQRAAPFVLMVHQLLRCADPRGHMRVMPAGVHHAGFHAGCGRRLDGGGERQPGLFDHRQAVHVRADQHGRPLAVLHHRNHTGLADTFGHLKAQRAHPCGELGCGLVFLEAEFGIGVEIAVQLHQLGHVLLHARAQAIILREGAGGAQQRARRHQCRARHPNLPVHTLYSPLPRFA